MASEVRAGGAEGAVDDHADGGDLAPLQVISGMVGVEEVVGDPGDLVVEPGQGRGVAGDLQPRGPGEPARGAVAELDTPAGLLVVLFVGLLDRVELRAGLVDDPLDPGRATRVQHRRQHPVDVGGGLRR